MIESLKKKADEENFVKKITEVLFDYYAIIPKKEEKRRSISK